VLAAESVRSAAEAHRLRLAGVKLVVLPDALLQSLSGTETSQGVMALSNRRSGNSSSCSAAARWWWCSMDCRTPATPGAIARAAEAFGATGLLFLKGTVSPYNPKTLRASAGSLYRIPFLHGVDAALARAALRQNKVELYAGVPARAGTAVRSLAEADLSGPCGLAIGNEARGVGASCARPRSIFRSPQWEWNRSTPPWRPASCCTSAPAESEAAMSLFDSTPPESETHGKRPLAERMRPEPPRGLHRAGAYSRAGEASAPPDRAR